MSTYIEQLAQIFNGAVWDGDLISKRDRDQLVRDGLVTRSCGYNIVTPDGVVAYTVVQGTEAHGCAEGSIQDTIVRLFAKIAVRRFGSDKGYHVFDGIFNGACFASVISDLMGLPSPDGQIVKLILADRDWIRSDRNSHYETVGVNDVIGV